MPEDPTNNPPPEPPGEEPRAREELRARMRRLLEDADTGETAALDDETMPLETPDDLAAPNAESADLNETQHPGISWRDEPPGDSEPIPIGDAITPTSLRVPDEPEEPDDLAWAEEAPTRKIPLKRYPPPPALGDTPMRDRPAIDKTGMPLPRRVDQVDRGATRVTPAAYRPQPRSAAPGRPAPAAPGQAPGRSPEPTVRPGTRTPGTNLSRAWGCLVRSALLGGFVLILVFIVFAAYAVFQYYRIEATLPEVNDLRNRASQFETSTILDRNGNVLYEIIDPNAGRRTYVSLDEISPFLIAATLATEDKSYYSHPGFDAWAILRAFYQNWQSGETVSGASTITQQLARMLFFDEEERYERTYMRKVREALLAIAITDNYSKDEILELYLNEIYYGNLAYGIEAASQTYFHTPASQLDMGQAAFLAGLPQAPAVYDVYTNPDSVVGRLQDVLVLMVAASEEENCIFVGVQVAPICVEPQEAALAFNQIIAYPFTPPVTQIRYPHWVTFIRSELEKLVDAQTIYRSGFIVRTTLDPVLQDKAQEVVAEQVAALADRNAHNGALVAIDPVTGEILAMIGSVDFYDDAIDGQVNMALAPRQPGSAIKPLTYVAAFEKGWTPSTLIWDVPSEFPPSGIESDPSPPYKPVNYDERFHGPVTLRSALANSYNVPAVKTLDFIGIYDNPDTSELDGLVGIAQRLGITSLTRLDYGLALTLGGGEVPLIELAGAYQAMANGGRRIPAVGILSIEDRAGNVIFQYNPPTGDPVIRPEHAYLISSILSDNAARTPMFGPNSVLNLPFPAASKTGTTNDFRDNWTMGYTNDIVVGVWVGNADNSPMVNTSGLSGAAPIYAEFMTFAAERLSGGSPGPFPRPANIVERIICTISGAEPSRFCPNQRSEFFAGDQPPRPASDDLWKEVLIDTWTGFEASPFCSEFTEEELVINVTDTWAVRWIDQTDAGSNWAESTGFEKPFRFAPRRACEEGDPQPTVWFDSPFDTQEITSTEVPIIGRVDAPDGIEEFTVDWGRGEDPNDWNRIARRINPFPGPEELGVWKLDPFTEPGLITLRIYVTGEDGGYAIRTIQVRINIPTPTPTPTETPTETPSPTITPTETPTPTITPSPTPTPPVTPTPTSGIPPTVTPSETSTP